MKRSIIIDGGYRVLEIINSTKYKPGQVLSKNQVESLCSTRTWRVRIREALSPPSSSSSSSSSPSRRP